ncbi:MAG: hypothetical protein CMH26_05895 [Micavibrio sp.]|nr:hypothetical protein [Micavibrio sp.]
MSDEIVPPPQELDAPENKPGLTSLEFDALQDALHTLYIPGNQSGRIHFTQSWPQIANYLFDAQLIHYDTHGATDKAHRDQLELEAIQRLDDLLVSIEGIVEKSAKSGVLQVEFVQPLVNKLGRDLALLVYNEEIVNRFAPETVQTAPEEAAPTQTHTPDNAPASAQDTPSAPMETQTAAESPEEEQVIEPVQTLEPEAPPAMEPLPTEPLQEAPIEAPIEASPVEPPLIEPIDEAPAPAPEAVQAEPIQQEPAPIEAEPQQADVVQDQIEPQPIAEPVQQPPAEEPTQAPEAKIFASTTVSQQKEPLSELKAQLIAKKIELESKAQSEEN